MRTLLVSALALGAMTSVALAGEPASKATPAKAAPVVLTEAQMDQVAAGQVGVCVVCANVAVALNLLSTDSTAETGAQTINIGTGG